MILVLDSFNSKVRESPSRPGLERLSQVEPSLFLNSGRLEATVSPGRPFAVCETPSAENNKVESPLPYGIDQETNHFAKYIHRTAKTLDLIF